MALNKAKVKDDLKQYALLQGKIGKLESQRNKALDPLIRAHNEQTAPIIEKYDQKLSPLREKLAVAEKSIKDALNSNVDSEGKPKVCLIEIDNAFAQVEKQESSRVIDAEKFFAAVKAKNQQFWASINVVIKHAEKLLGKEKIDEISNKKTTYNLTVSLKK